MTKHFDVPKLSTLKAKGSPHYISTRDTFQISTPVQRVIDTTYMLFLSYKILINTNKSPFNFASFFKFFFFNVYLFLWQRDTDHERGRGRERGRHRIGNRLQALSHQPRAWRGAWTHGLRDRDLAEVGRLTDCATQAPRKSRFLITLPVPRSWFLNTTLH